MKGWIKLVLDSVLIAGILIFSLYGVYTYVHYPTYLQTNSEQFEPIENVPIFYLNMNATSTAFSAGNKITVSIIAVAYNIFPNYTAVRPNFTVAYVEFPYAQRTPPAYNSQGGALFAYIMLVWNNATQDFRGSTTLSYSQAGSYCAIAVPHLTNLAGVSGFSSLCNGYATMLTIDSSNTLFQSQAARASLALAWIVLALTLVFVRDFGEKVWQDISQFAKDHGKPEARQTQNAQSSSTAT